jgi:hypothetical protein
MTEPFGCAGLEGGNARFLLPLSQHAQNTLLSLARLHPQSSLKISPFCHEHPEGAHEVRGWCLDTPGSAPASSLPINCSMFDGVSVVRCDCSEAEILELLSNADDTRRRLGEAINQIMTSVEEGGGHRASWSRCRPTLNGTPPSLCSASVLPSSSSSAKKAAVHFFNTQDCVPIIDSEHWVPELSPEGFIGLYHHWNHHRYEDNGQKTGLSLYIVCQSYLPKACLEFADMVRDIGDACTVSDIYHSEEAHWLRQACARNRCRMIASVCQYMKIRFPAMLDYNACKKMGGNTLVALSSMETLHHDIQVIPISHGKEKELIRILNYCTVPHQRQHHHQASSCIIMAPWEGVWVFHGNQQQQCEPLFFPSITPKITEQDHHSLKQKNRSSSAGKRDASDTSLFSFTCDIPEVCETLNVFYHFLERTPSSKKKKSKKHKTVVTRASALRQTLAMQELHDIAMSSMLTLPVMAMDKQGLETMKQVMMLKNGASVGVEDSVKREHEDQDDDDVKKAYKLSIAKLTSLVLNHISNTSNNNDGDGDGPESEVSLKMRQRPRKHTYLTFDESVLRAMEGHGWKRSAGYTVLIPLACGLCEHWKRISEETRVNPHDSEVI